MYSPYSPHPATIHCRCGWWGMVWNLVKDNQCPQCYSHIHIPCNQKKFLVNMEMKEAEK